MTRDEFESLEVGDIIYNNSAVKEFRVQVLSVLQVGSGYKSYNVKDLDGDYGTKFVAFTPQQYRFPDTRYKFKILEKIYEKKI